MAASTWAQISEVPYAENMGPLYDVSTVNGSFAKQYQSIRDVDFRNMPLEPGGRGFPLKNGKYERQDQNQFDSIELDSIFYLDSPGSSVETYALVVFYCVTGGGSATSSGIAQVYERLDVGQRITWVADARSGSKSGYFLFDRKGKVLVIRSAHHIPGDAHCCISAVDVVTFAWKGTHFEKTSVRTKLSEYGRRAGKKLPHP